jgi:peptidoglycan/LPS O-acetylase OafA/YrhL
MDQSRISAIGPSHHRPYRADIDGLRALAVFCVVVFHAFPGAIPGGFVGVDIFFVISGFLINGILLGNLGRGSLGLGDFYIHRIKRIVPALVLVLVTTLVVGWYGLLGTEYQELGRHALSSAGFVVNFVLLGEAGYFDAASETKTLLHLWSLAVEEQFYLVWPVLLAIVWKLRGRPILLVAVLATVSFGLCLWLTRVNPAAAFFLPSSRLWELLIGAALSSTAGFGLPARLRNASAALGALLVLVTLFVLRPEDSFPGWWALPPTAGAALLIAAGPQAWINQRLLSARGAVWLGKISYPLYLWHWPVLTLSRTIHGGLPAWQVRVALLSASVALAWLTYVGVERPIRFGAPARWKYAVPLALLVLVGVLGYDIDRREGMPFRAANRGMPAMKSVADGWYRHSLCMIDAADVATGPLSFARECDGRSGPPGHRLVMLWGDSHAASFYPGFLAYARQQGIDLAQFTATGCPPLPRRSASTAHGQCAEVDPFVLKKIASLKPDVVFIAGYWSKYTAPDGGSDAFAAELLETISEARVAGAGRVVLIGNLPVYSDGLPGIASRVFVGGKTDRTYRGFEPGSRVADELTRAIAKQAGVEFLSPIEALCNAEGCLMSSSHDELKPIAWDYGHLTRWGAEFLVDKMTREHPAAFVLRESSKETP